MGEILVVFEYVIGKEDVKEALQLAGVIKRSLKRYWIIAGCLLLFVISHIIDYFKDTTNYTPLMIAGMFVVVIVLVLSLPKKMENDLISSNVLDSKTVITLGQDFIGVFVPESKANWQIGKDDVLKIKRSENVVVFQLNDKRIFPIPLNSIKDKDLKDKFEDILIDFSL